VSGSGEIWITDGILYKFVLETSTGVLIATYDNISGINSNFVAFTNQQEIVTATAGQTVFNLGISYQPATNSLSVFVDGVNQYGPGAQYAYTETDSDTVTFTSGLHVGAEVKFTTTQQQGGGAVDASQVSYQPPFTGSVATNVEAKLEQYVSVMDFGAVGNGVVDDTAAFNDALATGRRVYAPAGTYLVNIDTTGIDLWYLYGDGMDATILRPFDTNLPVFMNMSDPGSANFWRRSRLSDLAIRRVGSVGGNGFTFGNPALFTLNDERIGRVDFENVEIQAFNKAIFKTCGNICNSFTNCRIQNNDYNYYAQSDDYVGGPGMHAGGDNFYGGSFGYAGLASIFIKDRKLGHGGWTFTGVDIEGSPGYAVVALCSGIFGQIPNITFDCCWFEANAYGGSITIDGLTGTITGLPRDIYALGNHQIVARSIYLGKITLLGGANLIADKCGTDTFTAGIYDLVYDNDSTFIADGWTGLTQFNKSLTLAPYATKSDIGGLEYTPSFNATPSPVASVVKDFTVKVGRSGTSYYYQSNGVEQDGMTFNTSNRYVVTSYTQAVPTFATTVGKYYACSIQVRLVSGAAGDFVFDNLMNTMSVDHAEWRQYNIVKKAASATSDLSLFSASSTTFGIGAVQVVEFDTANAAYEYLYRGRMAVNSDTRGYGNQPGVYTAIGSGATDALSFNSASIANIVVTTGYRKLCEANFVGNLTNLSVDFMIAYEDFSTGLVQTQPAGFNTVAFSSISATPTLVLGAATVTFRWVLVSGTVYQPEAQSSGTDVAIAGLAFIKGK
jgi:hypothetical protein